MQGESNQEQSWEPLLETSSSDDADFDDSLLQALSQSAPQPMPKPRLGEWLGGKEGHRFKILALLGSGAMGCVFRAWDEELHRSVALKFLLSRGARERMFELLRQEARVIAQLDHENIVRLFDVSEWSPHPEATGLPFLVMECLEGEALASLLRRERPELSFILRIMGEVTAGLAHAHGQHVIHRDLKPSNVFLTPEGRAKLLDFGLAHLLAAGSSPHSPLLMMAGTPGYMAPEQWRGEEQDERTDLWAVGMMLYEMLTGELPFPLSDLRSLRARVTSPEPMPSIRERRPELSWEVSVLVDTALAKAPAQRFQTAQELHQELRELEEYLGFRRPTGGVLPQRRQVTLLACSLTGITELIEHLDAEDLDELEAIFHQVCTALIQKQGGYPYLSMGNEVLACFGYPHIGEEDAAHAVRAGLHLARYFSEELQKKWTSHVPHLPKVRVGIHTETVDLEEQFPGPRGQLLVLRGDAPKVVTWLAQQAEPGTVWLSGTTWRLVRGTFETQAQEPRAVPWQSSPSRLDLHRVVREWPAVSRFDRRRLAGGLTPLVGRERELQLLLEHWERARGGQGSCVLLSGEPGIGKSRLIREVGERTRADGGLWLQSQCWSELSASPLHPVIELLRRYLPNGSPEHRLSALDASLGDLGLSAEASQLLAALLLPVPADRPMPRLSPERRKEMTYGALRTVLARAAAERAILLVVEDVHWADPSTLELLGWMLERLEDTPVLLLLSARLEFHPPWRSSPGFHRLELERLPMEQITQVVRQAARRRVLPEGMVAQMAARSDGIPLFAEEMARLMCGQASASGTPPATSAIPLTLQELLLARLDRLPGRLKSLAQLGAAVGRGFSQVLLSQLTGRSEAMLRRDLGGLVRADLLQSQEGSTGPEYQFRHALLQEAAYQSLPRSKRREHHRHIAQALGAHFPKVVEAQPEVMAHHFTEAGEVEPAIHFWARAGELASQRLANEEAIRHLTQALQLLLRLPESPKRSERELRLLLALGAPLLQLQGYGSPDAERTYTRVQELLRTGGEALAEFELPSYWVYTYHCARTHYALAHEVAEHTVARGRRRNDPELLAQGTWMQAQLSYIRGQLKTAQLHAWRSEACSNFDLERHRAVAAMQWVNPRVVALAFSAVFQSELDDLEAAHRYSQEALELAWRIGHPHTMAYALVQAAMGCHFREDAPEALRLAEEAGKLADEHGFRLWRVWVAPFQSWALAALGRPWEGLTLMQEGRESLQTLGALAYRFHYSLGILADIHLRLGQPRDALALLTEALRHLDTVGERFYEAELYRLRGDALQGLGREEDARKSFFQAVRVARMQGARALARRAEKALRLQLLSRSPRPPPLNARQHG